MDVCVLCFIFRPSIKHINSSTYQKTKPFTLDLIYKMMIKEASLYLQELVVVLTILRLTYKVEEYEIVVVSR